MKYIFTSLFMMFFLLRPVSSLHGQPVAELKARLSKSQLDTGAVMIYNRLSEILGNVDPATAMVYADSALSLSMALCWDRGYAYALKNRGNVFRTTGRSGDAAQAFNQVLYYGAKLGDAKLLGRAYGSLGALSLDSSNFISAITFTKLADSFFVVAGERGPRATCQNNIAKAMLNMGNYVRAAGHFVNAFTIAVETRNKPLIVAALNNLGAVHISIAENSPGITDQELKTAETYLRISLDSIGHDMTLEKQKAEALGNIGVIQQKRDDHRSAIVSYRKVAAIFDKMKDVYGALISRVNIGISQLKAGDYRAAINTLHLELAKIRQTPFRLEERKTLLNLAASYQRINEFDSARSLLKDALTISEKIKDPEGIKDARLLLSYTGEHEKDYKAAYEELGKSMRIKDSLYGLDKRAEMAAMQAKFEMQIKQNQVDNQKHQIEMEESQSRVVTVLILWLAAIALFLSAMISGKWDVRPEIIKLVCGFSILVFTECIVVYLHPLMEHYFHGNALYMVAVLVTISIMISLLHHKLEKFALLYKFTHASRRLNN